MSTFFPGKFSIAGSPARARVGANFFERSPRGGTTSIPTYFKCLNTPTLLRTCLLIPESPHSGDQQH
jgi:hypothetical protein